MAKRNEQRSWKGIWEVPSLVGQDRAHDGWSMGTTPIGCESAGEEVGGMITGPERDEWGKKVTGTIRVASIKPRRRDETNTTDFQIGTDGDRESRTGRREVMEAARAYQNPPSPPPIYSITNTQNILPDETAEVLMSSLRETKDLLKKRMMPCTPPASDGGDGRVMVVQQKKSKGYVQTSQEGENVGSFEPVAMARPRVLCAPPELKTSIRNGGADQVRRSSTDKRRVMSRGRDTRRGGESPAWSKAKGDGRYIGRSESPRSVETSIRVNRHNQ